jgi:hypothetical protein
LISKHGCEDYCADYHSGESDPESRTGSSPRWALDLRFLLVRLGRGGASSSITDLRSRVRGLSMRLQRRVLEPTMHGVHEFIELRRVLSLSQARQIRSLYRTKAKRRVNCVQQHRNQCVAL